MSSDPVTFVVRHQVRADCRDDYERWLSRITPRAREYSGHQGVNIVRPAPPGDVYTIVLHFACLDDLQQWIGSPDRGRLIDEVRPMLGADEETTVETSSEFWFTPPVAGHLPPKRWKQFAMTLSVIYPLSLLAPMLWQPLLALLPDASRPWLGGLVVASSIVFVVVYWVMPPYTRLLAGWLNHH